MSISKAKSERLNEKVKKLNQEVKQLNQIQRQLKESSGGQISLTDPDVRFMATSGRGLVGYNVQAAVDSEHHLLLIHEVTNQGHYRAQLSNMATQAKTVVP
jgi:hypothetical protein